MNSGAEAVETAIKAVRRWGYEKRAIPDGEAEIIVMDAETFMDGQRRLWGFLLRKLTKIILALFQEDSSLSLLEIFKRLKKRSRLIPAEC